MPGVTAFIAGMVVCSGSRLRRPGATPPQAVLGETRHRLEPYPGSRGVAWHLFPRAHAQILFWVAGALTVIIIGDSLARPFGAAGVASTVRFRTPMKDPEDATILFLLIGTLFLCVLLWVLDRRRTADVRGSVPDDAHAIAASH